MTKTHRTHSQSADEHRRAHGSDEADYFDDHSAPSVGEMQLDERSALRRVQGLSTELTDVTEVEYRQLRLEVWCWSVSGRPGTAAQADASMASSRRSPRPPLRGARGLVQRRDKPDAATYIGSGKADELRQVVLATGADTVICDGELTPAQLTALEKVVKVKVIDRTALILDIFAQHATSREGKAQVALAQMEYMLPRLRGWGESMSRQAGGRAGSNGGVGLRGPRRDEDRDRPPAHPRADGEVAARDQGYEGGARHQAQPSPAQRDPVRRDRRIHQRRQVEPAQRPHRVGCAGPRTRCSRPWIRRPAGVVRGRP